MNKRKWKIISKKPYKLLIAVLVIASLMGMSYGAFTDQLNIGGFISIKLPDKPDKPDVNHGIKGEIMITDAPDYYIKAGSTTCPHEAIKGECKKRKEGTCTYHNAGRGISFRYPIKAEEAATITKIDGICRFEMRAKDNSSISYKMAQNIESYNTQVIYKKGEGYLDIDKEASGANITLEEGGEYILESDVLCFDTQLKEDTQEDVDPDAKLDDNFKKYYEEDRLDELEVEAILEYNIYINESNTPDLNLSGKLTQVLSVGKYYEERYSSSPKSLGMYTTQPALTIVPPTHTLPPDITLPEVTTNPQLDIMLLPELYEDNPSGE